MRPEKHERHVRLSTGAELICDICQEFFGEPADERCVALVGNASSTAFRTGFLHPFGAEHRYGRVLIGKWRLCAYSESMCFKWDGPSRPGCFVHADCLQIFLRNWTAADDALDRFWQACVWGRVPWTGARVPWTSAQVPALRVAPRPVWHFLDTFVYCAERCGIHLGHLPQVVVGSIMESLPWYDDFWRCVTAIDLARRLSATAPQPLRIVPLSRLVSWERGSPPQVAPEESAEMASLPPFVRLTIDLDGLKKVERLPSRPQFKRQRFDDHLFVVEREAAFGVTIAYSKNGLLHLSVLEDFEEPGFDVWDTPTPPDLAQCPVPPDRESSMLCYHTLDLTTATGITFFLKGATMLAIHAHTRSQPSAWPTWATLSELPSVKYCVWIYVPLPPRDTVLSCGPLVGRDAVTRGRAGCRFPYFLLRTRLSGETVVGRYKDRYSPEDEDSFVFFASEPDRPPTTLMYTIGPQQPAVGTSTIATYDGHGQTGTLTEPLYYPPPSSHPYFQHSYAPLEHVRKIRVFYHDDGVHCRGMFFEYDNGGQRAVGQCRILVDASRTYERPSSIAFANTVLTDVDPATGKVYHYPKFVRVSFDGPCVDGEKWSVYAMAGTLEFWFTAGSESISVREGTLVHRGRVGAEEEEGESMLGVLQDIFGGE